MKEKGTPSSPIENIQIEKSQPWAVVTIGECGQGKSTALSTISKLFNANFARSKHVCSFDHRQSYESVTGVVKTGTTGLMTLTDTPGFNDTNA